MSARHAHLSAGTLDRLFGVGYRLHKHADLSQPGQYSSEETVTLIGPRGRVERVRVLGPPRSADQIEISRSDEFVLGVDAPVRLSGDLAGTPGITLEGPRGRVTIERGVICARRHIHMSPADGERLGVRDGQIVQVRIDSEGRDLTFADVIVRVAEDFRLELHLDTDEANAAGLSETVRATLVPGAPDRGTAGGVIARCPTQPRARSARVSSFLPSDNQRTELPTAAHVSQSRALNATVENACLQERNVDYGGLQ